jgi:hypothetical protein
MPTRQPDLESSDRSLAFFEGRLFLNNPSVSSVTPNIVVATALSRLVNGADAELHSAVAPGALVAES